MDDCKHITVLLNAVSDLVEHCNKKGLLIRPTLLENLPKGPSWFRAFIKLCFSGMCIEKFPTKDLGLDGPRQVCDEHRVYSDILERLQSIGDIRDEMNYKQLMNWLVRLDFIEDIKNESVIERVPGWQKTMQPELCHLATDADKYSRKGFDSNMYKKNLFIYKHRHSFMKQQILEAFIAEAPREFVLNIFKQWLKDEAVCGWLFKQCYYPLNMFTNEYCPWNLFLHGLQKILPEAKGDIKTSFKQCTGINEAVEEDFPEKDLLFNSHWTDVFGRTLIRKDKKNSYLKVQSNTESDTEFRRGYSRLKRLRDLHSDLNLESLVPLPKRLCRIREPYKFIESVNPPLFSCSNKKTFKEKVVDQPSLAMEFETPLDTPYEEYVYDVPDDRSAYKALQKYSRDYGKMWRHGLLPPPCLSAFHDVDDDRKHVMLAPLANMKGEGSMEQWNGEATDYPNIGGPEMGMRDKVDIVLPEEKGKEYFSRQIINPDTLEDQNKIRLEELAKAAQGLCLQYARKFNTEFDYTSQKSIEKIKRDIGELLTDLFSNALPLSKDECKTLMKGHDLLNQCCREISYWLANKAPYVSDLRKAEINFYVYPHLPPSMQGCVLTDKQSECLKDHGFVDMSKRYQGGSCKLGAPSGRMPLIALNALVVKILAYGTVRIAEIQQHDIAEALKAVAKQQFVV